VATAACPGSMAAHRNVPSPQPDFSFRALGATHQTGDNSLGATHSLLQCMNMADERIAASSARSEVFKERLKRAREFRRWSQDELAARARVHPSAIAHFEIGPRRPSFDALRRLADTLEITTDYLLGRVDEQTMSEIDDPLLRDLSKLPAEYRELARNFLQMLADQIKATNK
jgi:transcriptional regulator with XRE-family HTH domain